MLKVAWQKIEESVAVLRLFLMTIPNDYSIVYMVAFQ